MTPEKRARAGAAGHLVVDDPDARLATRARVDPIASALHPAGWSVGDSAGPGG